MTHAATQSTLPPTGLWPVASSELTAFGRENIGALRLFGFLNACLRQRYAFTVDELLTATGYAKSSWKTYHSKQLANVLKRDRQGRLHVLSALRRVPVQKFLDNFTQSRQLVSKYSRAVFGQVVTYEFLLPLSRENELQQSLDELFYSDALRESAEQIDLEVLSSMVDREEGEDENAFRSRVAGEVGKRFGGYSIVHVAGRFRSGNLLTRAEASDLSTTGFRYLIDETTAVVRFLVPLPESECALTEDPRSVRGAIESLKTAPQALTDSLDAEVAFVRALFFLFFVEAVVETVRGEEEIWLVETSPEGSRVFVWRRTT